MIDLEKEKAIIDWIDLYDIMYLFKDAYKAAFEEDGDFVNPFIYERAIYIYLIDWFNVADGHCVDINFELEDGGIMLTWVYMIEAGLVEKLLKQYKTVTELILEYAQEYFDARVKQEIFKKSIDK